MPCKIVWVGKMVTVRPVNKDTVEQVKVVSKINPWKVCEWFDIVWDCNYK